MSEIADQILEAVDIIVDKKVSDLAFNKTIRGKISKVVDSSIGEYKIQYQNSYFTAYSADSSAVYQKGSEVYVEILSNDFEKNALILGTVQRLGSNYVSIVEKLDKYTNIGEEFSSDAAVEFCSYGGSQSKILFQSSDDDIWKLDKNLIKEAAAAADSIKIGLKIKNNLSAAQRQVRGDFGIKIVVRYYNEGYDEAYIVQNPDKQELQLEREYIFNVNEMTGQPYKYLSYTDQYYVFPIDAKNFIEIISIEAFCKDFIENQEKTDIDIWFKDFNLQFLESLKEEELQDTSLKILTPKGFCFSDKQTNNKLLQAQLKIKGKPVNLESQKVDFFWHIRDAKASSTYGGRGWRQLNQLSYGTYKWEISIDQCAAAETEFKCVACYLDNGQSVQSEATIVIKNIQNDKPNLYIESSMGKIFAFNIGKTTLILQGAPQDATDFYWLESIDGGNAALVKSGKTQDDTEDNKANQLNVDIRVPSARTLSYTCSAYKDETLIGTVAITLVNNKEALGYTLVINNATQIFKYDVYGTSPAAQGLAEVDKIKIEPLTFDIYDKQGNPIYFKSGQKHQFMTINWFWPDKTLLTLPEMDGKPEEDWPKVNVLDVANNRSVERKTYQGEKLVFGILDKYNAEIANAPDAMNNIELEVEYQGELLHARTNFTFIKEGELGTNGTKYLAKIQPKAEFAEIFIMNDSLYAAQYDKNAVSADGIIFVKLDGIEGPNNLNEIFDAHLWDGVNIVTDAKIKWDISSSTKRASNKPRLTITKDNDIIEISNEGTSYYNVLQATFSFGDLKYYATYPILYTTGLLNDSLVYLDNGYREVMFESDGTRGRFTGQPFYIRKWGSGGKAIPKEPEEISTNWDTNIKKVDDYYYQIEPPAFYKAENSENYIKVTLGNIESYFPIEMYLNRYSMAAMNDWDGNSIQLKDNGGYILAPQVGAGSKNDKNRFTGITIGEVFESNNNEIGLFGYGAGERTIFLDANTGDATFGKSGDGQIQIKANGEGVIQSGDYPRGQGMRIQFSSTRDGPYIKFGSGNFSVDKNGNITAKGGGTIAGWEITDSFLRSQDGKTILYSGTGEKDKDGNIIRIAVGEKDSAGNRKFTIDENGAITSIAGKIGGWVINQYNLQAGSGALTLTYNGYILGCKTKTGEGGFNVEPSGDKRIWGITPEGRAYFTDIKIQNQIAAKANPLGREGANVFSWYSGSDQSPVKIFELTDNACQMGGFNISKSQLTSGDFYINSANVGSSKLAVLSAGNAFQIYGDGHISASGGTIGGCGISGTGISGSGWALGADGMRFGADKDKVQLQDMKTPIGIEWANTYRRINIQAGWLSVDENNKITGYILIPDIKLRFNEYSVMRTKRVQLDAYYTTNRQGDN